MGPSISRTRSSACLPRLHRTDPTASGKIGNAAVGVAFRGPGAAELAPGPVPAAQGAGTGCAPEQRRGGFTYTGRPRLRCDPARGAGWARHPRLSHRGCRALQEPPFWSISAFPGEAWSEWLDSQRVRLEGLALDAMVKLGDLELQAGSCEQGLAAPQRGISIKNLRE